MGRNLLFLLIGVATGFVLSAALERSRERTRRPSSLADRITRRLESLEEGLTVAP